MRRKTRVPRPLCTGPALAVLVALTAFSCANAPGRSMLDCQAARTSVLTHADGSTIYVEAPHVIDGADGPLMLGGPAWRVPRGAGASLAGLEPIAGAWLARDECGIASRVEAVVPLPGDGGRMNVVRAGAGPSGVVVAWRRGRPDSAATTWTATLSRRGWSGAMPLLPDAKRVRWISSRISNVATSGAAAVMGVPVVSRDSLYLLRAVAGGWERRGVRMPEHVYSRLAFLEDGQKLALAYVTAAPGGAQAVRVRIGDERSLEQAADTVLHGTAGGVDALEINAGEAGPLVVAWVTRHDQGPVVDVATMEAGASPWRRLTRLLRDADATHISRPVVAGRTPFLLVVEQRGPVGAVVLLSYDAGRWREHAVWTMRGRVAPHPTLSLVDGQLLAFWGAVPDGEVVPSTWMFTQSFAGPLEDRSAQ